MTFYRQFALTFLASAILSASAHGQNETTKIYLKGNRYVSAAELVAEETQLRYRAQNSKSDAWLPYSQIDSIEWQEPEVWNEIVELAEARKFEIAVQRLLEVTRAPRRFTHYPAPGNFSTRARRLLAELYRAQMNGAGVAEQMDFLRAERQLLPPAERALPDSLEAWVAAEKKDWATVFELAEKFPTNSDIAYLEGRGLLANKDNTAAEYAFTKAYSLEAGANTAVSRQALRESILIRATPVKVHTYATVFGKGGLWEGAASSLQTMLAKPLNSGENVLGEEEGTGSSEDFRDTKETAKRLERVK